VSSLRGCVEIFGYWWASPRHHATTQIDTNTNRTVRASRPVLNSPFSRCHLFDYPGPQFAREHLLQHVRQIQIENCILSDHTNQVGSFHTQHSIQLQMG
jgi:hypothetical protein